MRKIEFRGKSIKDGTWVYGYYESTMQVSTDRKTAIIHVEMDWGLNHHIEVWDDTVGQYTGLKDKNGKKIYEGDLVSCATIDGNPVGLVGFETKFGCWEVQDPNHAFGGEHFGELYCKEMEVVGNIHDNPKLLETK